MDFYSIFKFLHVLAAMAWFGGGAIMLFMAILALSKDDEAAMMNVAGRMGGLGMTWFVPAAGLTLLFGAVVATIGGLWGDAWVVLGLVGAIASFVGGHFVLRPMGENAGKLMSEGRVAEAAVYGRQLVRFAQFDYCNIIAIIALMVLKPGWSDPLALAVIYGALAVAGFLLLGRKPGRGMQAAE